MIVSERRRRSRSRSRERRRRRRTRSRSPRSPYRSRRSFSPGFDSFSDLTALENIRDRGLSRSPGRPSPLDDFDRRPAGFDAFSNEPPRLMAALRVLTAIEDLLGSLGPQVNVIMSRAIALENKRDGTSNMLLEDPDIAAILQMTKEKLYGQIMAGNDIFFFPLGHLEKKVAFILIRLHFVS